MANTKWTKEYRKEYHKQYREDHKEEKRTKSRYRCYKIRDKEHNHSETVDYNYEEFLYRISTNKCIYCDSTDNLGLDRIDNSKGHSKDNTVVCCRRCNETRWDNFTVEEFKLFSPIIQQIDISRRNS